MAETVWELAERIYFVLCLVLGWMLRSAKYSNARIVDQGYRRYEGPRLGARGAQRALYVASVQRAVGLRRRFRHKVIPLLVTIMAYLPELRTALNSRDLLSRKSRSA